MALLNVPTPRFKPGTGAQTPQVQQVLREAPTPAVVQAGPTLTPEQVARKRAIAEQLAQSGMDYSPVQHWTQGLARVANVLAGDLEESRAMKAEKEGSDKASQAFNDALEEKDPQARMTKLLAAAENPWASKIVQSYLGEEMARQNPELTPEQLNYQAAQKDPKFGEYQIRLREASAYAPTAAQKDFQYAQANPDFKAAQDAANPPRPLPSGVQGAEDEDIGAVQGAESINAQLGSVVDMIDGGKLELGLLNNLGAQAQNMVGLSSENSINFATTKATLEKMRNQTLALQKGVQTEGDATRAWNELVANLNDPAVVKAQIARIQELNNMAAAQRLQRINVRRERNKVAPLDPRDITGIPLGGAQTEQFAPLEGETQGAPIKAPAAPVNPGRGPAPGTIEDGLMFKGGDPGDERNWVPADGAGGPALQSPQAAQAPANSDPYGLNDLTNQRKAMTARHRRMLTQ